MNKNVIEAQQLMFQLLDYKKNNATNCEVWIAPPSLYLMMAKDLYEQDEIGVFAQDMSEYESGAYTGEISANMLESIDATERLSDTQNADNTTVKPIPTATER